MHGTNVGPANRIAGFAKKFAKDDSGVATVEALFWIPVFAFSLILVTDISFFFYERTQVLRILQESNRSYAIGRLQTTAELEELVLSRIAPYSASAKFSASIQDGVINSTLTIPASELMALGKLARLSDVELSISSIQYIEG